MKQLLQQDFSLAFDSAHTQHVVSEMQEQDDFSFVDQKACRSCRPFFIDGCNNEVFLLHSSHLVNYVNIEEFLDSFKQLKGERCDGLLYDGEKIAFFDMYCGMSDFLDVHLIDGKPTKGKKTKVKDQIEATIVRFNSVHSIETYFSKQTERVAIFAYRIPYDEVFNSAPTIVQSSGNKMLAMAKMIQNRRLSLPMSCGFKYISVRYPERYQW